MSASVPANRSPSDRNADATVHIAQLDDKVTDALLWELMVQAAPVRHVYIPRDRITGSHFGYGFCEFYTALDALYATKILNMLPLYSKRIRISQSTIDRRSQDIGANLFIGNLNPEVDEKLLHDAFSAFGPLLEAPYIMRDAQTNESKRYAFVKYTNFEHSDSAIAAMNGQYICNNPISVQYAFKKDCNLRERHGSKAERILAARAAEARRTSANEQRLRPHRMFADRSASETAALAKKNSQQAPAPPPPPPHPAYAAPSQQAYPYPTQPYHAPGAQLPHWQTNPRMQPYAHAPQTGFRYEQAPPPYQPYVAAPQIGWSANRAYGNGPAEAPPGCAPGQPYHRPGGHIGVPVRVPDDQAPPPPKAGGT